MTAPTVNFDLFGDPIPPPPPPKPKRYRIGRSEPRHMVMRDRAPIGEMRAFDRLPDTLRGTLNDAACRLSARWIRMMVETFGAEAVERYVDRLMPDLEEKWNLGTDLTEPPPL